MRILFIILAASISFFCNAQNIKRKGSLGVGLYNILPDSISQKLNLKVTNGAMVQFVVPKSTSDIIGIKQNDFITDINNKPINNTSELISIARQFRADDDLFVTLIRDNTSIKLKGKVVSKPFEESQIADIIYGEFKFETGYIRTLYKKPKNKKIVGTVYFIQGISCYSLDNMQPLDPTKLAIDAILEKGFAVYSVEKSCIGDSYGVIPCAEMGFDKELAIFREGYKNLLSNPDIDSTAIFVFGHSLGGVSAPLIAQEFSPKGIIVYGTVLKPWGEYYQETLVLQPLLYGENLKELNKKLAIMKPTFNEIFKTNKPIDKLASDPKHLQNLKDGIEYNETTKLAAAGRTIQFHREINGHDLVKAWKNVNAYTLAIYGECDIAANNDKDHKAIIKIVNKYHPKKGTYLLMPKTNHTFQEVGSMAEYIALQKNPIEYEKYASQHFNSKLFEKVCDWMNDKLTKKL